MNCPQCGTELQDRAIYCPYCAIQTRCKQCREELAREARACVTCGTLTTPANAIPSPQASTVNRIRFIETDKRRSLDAELTDDAVGLIAQSLGMFVTGQLQPRRGTGTQLPGQTPIIVDQRLPSLPGREAGHRAGATDGVALSGQDGAVHGSNGSVEALLTHLDSSAHREVYAAPRVLEQALHVLRIARDDYKIDGLTAGQITQVLKDKFRLPVTPQGVYSAFDRVKGVVDRVPAGKGIWKFRLMTAGETFLADPEQATPPSKRRRGSRRGQKERT